MPQDSRVPGSPQDWFARAKGDLALARVPLPKGAFYDDLCFHAQQAAEKALKAVYQHHGWTFRYTHDLEQLVTGLKNHGLEIPAAVDAAIVLTGFAWEARYPGVGEPVTAEEHKEALQHAQAVVSWAARVIGEEE
ncbi:MAG: HEPN domain-containing protein [Thermoleophilia bacterium]